MKEMIFGGQLKKSFDVLPTSKTKCDILFYELDHIDGEDFYYKTYYLRDKDYSKKTKEEINNNLSTYLNEAKTLDQQVIDLAELEETIREKRNKLLQESDYILMPDYPIEESQLILWKEYRQKLRDITDQEGFPTNIIWPTKP